VSNKAAKKLRKFFREGMEKQGCKDFIEYSNIKKAQVKFWKTCAIIELVVIAVSIALVFIL